MPLSPPTPRQTHLFFRTDALSQLRSRRGGFANGSASVTHKEFFVILIAALEHDRAGFVL
jgi:hypothetical protein